MTRWTRRLVTPTMLVLVSLAGCSDGGERFARTVAVWRDDDGAYTCPADAPIATSDPPICAADPDDRIRLIGEVATESLADLPIDETSGWVTNARVEGRLSGDGLRIDVESITPT